MSMNRIAIAIAMGVMSAAPASAAPIYALGNECPTDAQMQAPSPYDIQFKVNDALACVFDPADANIGNGNAAAQQAEADLYLGLGWTAFGIADSAGDINGFGSNNYVGFQSGTFTIGAPLVPTYNQFAVGVKGGNSPHWAIFLLPVGDFSSAWSFQSQQGSLSHFTLYGRTNLDITQHCTGLPVDCTTTTVPDGGVTISLLGSALLGLGLLRRKFSA